MFGFKEGEGGNDNKVPQYPNYHIYNDTSSFKENEEHGSILSDISKTVYLGTEKRVRFVAEKQLKLTYASVKEERRPI